MSLYIRNTNVPAVRIGTYPKRRRFTDPTLHFPEDHAPRPVDAASGMSPDACYADFFRTVDETRTAPAATMIAS